MMRRKLRDVHGIVLLDKPVGITSNGALQMVKRLFQARKAGHTGSLDPLASGLLPLCFGSATKMSAFLLESDKEYQVTVKLGEKTTTGDAEGEVISRRNAGAVSDAAIAAVLPRYTGTIQQIPPMHSAIKQNGQPLYKLAHQGIEVERQPREVTIYDLRLLRRDGDALDLTVSCSKGTYIRTLAEDIGETLGVGAHVSALRRTAAGPFQADQMVGMGTLQAAAEQDLATLDSFLLPMDAALEQWPDVCLSEDMAYFLRQGQPVFVPKAPTSGWVKLRTADRRFLGVGCVLEDGRVAPKRLVSGA
ncbi:MAG: tRNA pseudouridine(55) synthase TruB [Pseudomonadota bacterium]